MRSADHGHPRRAIIRRRRAASGSSKSRSGRAKLPKAIAQPSGERHRHRRFAGFRATADGQRPMANELGCTLSAMQFARRECRQPSPRRQPRVPWRSVESSRSAVTGRVRAERAVVAQLQDGMSSGRYTSRGWSSSISSASRRSTLPDLACAPSSKPIPTRSRSPTHSTQSGKPRARAVRCTASRS